MLACLRAAAAACAAAAALCAAASPLLPSEQVRGVNLGGWLVLESWLYPAWYAAHDVPFDVGEGPFIRGLLAQGKDAGAVMHSLWDGWLQRSDLAALAAAGVTHVRIPVGYWILGAEFVRAGDPPFLPGGWPYLERALGWAKALGLRAVVELHAAPGSQNGLEHSGARGRIGWADGDNVRRTVDVLAALAARLVALNAQPATAGVVTGLGLLNEPWTPFVGGPVPMELYRAFVADATAAVIAAGWTREVWYSDGWNLQWPGWRGFLPHLPQMTMDRHVYRAFEPPGSLPPQPAALLELTCTADARLADSGASPHSLVVGEWSLAMPAWLAAANDVRFPFTDSWQAFHRAWFVAQSQAYNAFGFDPARHVRGAVFWNFKAETPAGEPWNAQWSYLTGLRDGYIPRSVPDSVAAGERVC